MDGVTRRVARARAPAREWWQSVPLELAVSAAAIFLAAGLKLAGLMP